MQTIIIVTAIALAAAVLILVKLLQGEPRNPCCESRGNLLTPAEYSFLTVLEQVLDSRYRVFAKVRLGDLVKPGSCSDTHRRTTLLEALDRYHVDFVVCTANELAPAGVLELGALPQGLQGRTDRDEFIVRALADAGIPLLRFPAAPVYAVQEVRAGVTGMLQGTARTSSSPSVPLSPLDRIVASTPVPDDMPGPSCPGCAARMVKRQALYGSDAGRLFWACPAFPGCGRVMDIV